MKKFLFRRMRGRVVPIRPRYRMNLANTANPDDRIRKYVELKRQYRVSTNVFVETEFDRIPALKKAYRMGGDKKTLIEKIAYRKKIEGTLDIAVKHRTKQKALLNELDRKIERVYPKTSLQFLLGKLPKKYRADKIIPDGRTYKNKKWKSPKDSEWPVHWSKIDKD